MNNDDIEVHAQAAYVVTHNDKVIEDSNVLAKYDGDKLDIMGRKDDKIVLMQLTNRDIMNILAIPSSSKTLEERLMIDFPEEKKRRKSTRRRKLKRSNSRRHSTTRRRKKSVKKHTPTVRGTPRGYKKPPTVTRLMGELD